MMNHTAAPTHRPLTDAEVDRLHKLHNRLEDARNFTASSKALAALNAYEHRLMAKGVSVEDIAALPRGL